MIRRPIVRFALVASLAAGLATALAIAAWPQPPSAQAQSAPVTIEWLGWSHFRFTSVDGKVVLTNPFVTNPDSPLSVADIERADLIFAADGHGDEVGSTIEIAQRTGARVFVPFELGTWLTEQGVPREQVVRSNPGGRLRLDGITARMVASVHGSGLPRPTATTPYGGPAAGIVITFENGWTVYFAGSTAATQDQALWAEMYRPDVAILPMGGGAEPKDFAMQVRLMRSNNPNLKLVIPHHHRAVQPPGQTSAAEVRAAMNAMGLDIRLLEPVVGEPYRFTR